MKRFLFVALPFASLVACGGTTYTTTMNGASEVPPVTTTATGTVTGTLNGTTIDFTGSYSGLSGPATAAHVHGPADAGETAGQLANCTLTAANDGGISGSCTTADMNLFNTGKAYVNVHTAVNPNGEIRGQLAKP